LRLLSAAIASEAFVSRFSTGIAVGMPVTRHPPHRSVLALLTHTAPRSDLLRRSELLRPAFGPWDTSAPALCRARVRPHDGLLAPGPSLPNLRSGRPVCSAGSSVLWPGQTSLRRTRPPYGSAPSRTALDSFERPQRSPGSRACCFSTCSGSLTTQGRIARLRSHADARVAFPSRLRGRRPGTVIFRSSIARPADASVYASTDASRRRPQDSRSRWFATPSL